MTSLTITAMGILLLLLGVFIMPTLELTETQFYLGLLVLVAFMVICFGVGQLAVIQEHLAEQRRTDQSLTND